MGDLIFSYREDKCGVKDQIKKKDSRKLRRKVTADEREGIDFLQRDLKYRLQNYAEQKAYRCAKTCIIKGIYSKENNGFLKTSKD